MTRAILCAGALLAAIVLAGCGGTGSGSANGTTGGVAGMHHGQGAASFRASVHGFEARLQTSVHAFQSGNLAKAIQAGGPFLNDCIGMVGSKIAPHASTRVQTAAVAHLRSACAEMSQAANAGASGQHDEGEAVRGGSADAGADRRSPRRLSFAPSPYSRRG